MTNRFHRHDPAVVALRSIVAIGDLRFSTESSSTCVNPCSSGPCSPVQDLQPGRSIGTNTKIANGIRLSEMLVCRNAFARQGRT